jgi:hypothetical protein
MADVKISGLPASTVPLTGTEVLPIVQGGTTKQVSIDNLTAGKAITATSYNKMAITAPATASTLTVADGKTLTANKTLILDGTDSTTMTFPATSATIARTDAAQTFTGAQIFNSTIRGATTIGVGAATPATTGAGITFPATQSASSDANTLDDYEEGTWTPVQGAGLTVNGTFTSVGRYTKIGRMVYLSGRLTGSTSVATTAGTIMMTGLPFTIFEASAIGTMTNGSLNTFGGVGAFTTTAYSTTTIAVTASIDFNIAYSV